jgi:hypothetical protein
LVKNRYDGEVGQSNLGFNKHTKRYIELTKVEREHLQKADGDLSKILENRQSKYDCIEPFYEENRRKRQETEIDDKRRLMLKDKQELTRQLNLSKMVKQVSHDLELYSGKQSTESVSKPVETVFKAPSEEFVLVDEPQGLG